MGRRIHQLGSLAKSAFHLKTPQTKFTLVVVDTWTTRFSDDNRCGWYCDHPDANYYTIGITNRLLNPSTIMAYVVQLHNGIYRLMFHVISVFNCFFLLLSERQYLLKNQGNTHYTLKYFVS